MSKTILTVQNINTTSKQQIFGLLLAIITVLIWSSYALSLRIGALSPLTLEELTFFFVMQSQDFYYYQYFF